MVTTAMVICSGGEGLVECWGIVVVGIVKLVHCVGGIIGEDVGGVL